jgi:hypothetical protein
MRNWEKGGLRKARISALAEEVPVRLEAGLKLAEPRLVFFFSPFFLIVFSALHARRAWLSVTSTLSNSLLPGDGSYA